MACPNNTGFICIYLDICINTHTYLICVLPFEDASCHYFRHVIFVSAFVLRKCVAFYYVYYERNNIKRISGNDLINFENPFVRYIINTCGNKYMWKRESKTSPSLYTCAAVTSLMLSPNAAIKRRRKLSLSLPTRYPCHPPIWSG